MALSHNASAASGTDILKLCFFRCPFRLSGCGRYSLAGPADICISMLLLTLPPCGLDLKKRRATIKYIVQVRWPPRLHVRCQRGCAWASRCASKRAVEQKWEHWRGAPLARPRPHLRAGDSPARSATASTQGPGSLARILGDCGKQGPPLKESTGSQHLLGPATIDSASLPGTFLRSTVSGVGTRMCDTCGVRTHADRSTRT